MNLAARARNHFERGDTLRAVLTLVTGLKKAPRVDSEAIGLFTSLIADELNSPGIEHEIAQVVVRIPNAAQYLGPMVVGLRARSEDRIADRIIAECAKRGLTYAPAAPRSSEPDDAHADASGDAEEPQTPDEPQHQEQATEDLADVPPQAVGGLGSEASDAEIEEEEADVENLRRVADANLSNRRERAAAQARDRRTKIRRRLTTWIGLASVVVAVAGVGHYVSRANARASALTLVDQELQSFGDAQAVNRVVAAAEGFDDPEFTERVAYAQALAGEAAEVRLGGWQTPFGHAASAIAGARAGRLEDAVASATKLERQHARSHLVNVALAIVHEARGRPADATKAARAALDRHPGFAVAHEVLVRTAVRSEDRATAEAAVAALSKHVPDHPYVMAVQNYPNARNLVLGGPVPAIEESQPAGDGDPFVAAVWHYRAAARSVRSGESGVEQARLALDKDPNLVGARVLLASSMAAQRDVEGAAQQFLRAAETAHGAAVTLLQAVAPISLSSAGSPRAAAQFTTPYPRLRGAGVGNAIEEIARQRRPAALKQPALSVVATDSAAIEALFARAETIAALGEYATAAAMLRDLSSRNHEPARAVAEANLLQPSPQTPVDPLRAGELAQFIVEAQGAANLSARVQEARIDAMLRLGRIEEASSAMGSLTGLARQPVADVLRMRLLARQQKTAEADAIFDALAAIDKPDARTAVGVARRAALKGKTTDAWKRIRAAMRAHPQDPWIAQACVHIALLRDNTDDAQSCGGVMPSSEHPDLLIEVGLMQLHAGQQSSAQESLAAAFAARPNPDAARALGRRIAAQRGSSMHRDLERAVTGAKAREDWRTAAALYEGALSRRPDDSQLQAVFVELSQRAGNKSP